MAMGAFAITGGTVAIGISLIVGVGTIGALGYCCAKSNWDREEAINEALTLIIENIK